LLKVIPPPDELACDFGANGIWVWNGNDLGVGTWNQISGANPDWMISVRWGDSLDEEIVASFPAFGVWHWDYSGFPGVWTQLTGVPAVTGLSVDDENDTKQELHLDFEALGLWRYDLGENSWLQLSAFNPTNYSLECDFWVTPYSEAAHAFPGYGVWVLYGYGMYYQQLTATDPVGDDHVSADFGVGDSSWELVIDFGGTLGMWLAAESSQVRSVPNWYRISTNNPEGAREVRFVGDAGYEIVADFAGLSGLWIWDFDAANWQNWTKIHNTTPGGGYYEPFDPDGFDETTGDEEIAVDFETLGLWLYDNTTGSWTPLSSSNPVYMVRCDLWGDGFKEELVVDFGNLGLWMYNGYEAIWFQLSGLSPD